MILITLDNISMQQPVGLYMVEVFKTNVHEKSQAAALLSALEYRFPSFRINFDLADCDRILRVEGDDIVPAEIRGVMIANGYACEVLE
jgi:hypothetical protein